MGMNLCATPPPRSQSRCLFMKGFFLKIKERRVPQHIRFLNYNYTRVETREEVSAFFNSMPNVG